MSDVFAASLPTPSDTLTYEPFFGLSEKPFSLNADPRFVYGSPTFVAACESLLAGIRRREGLLVLTGEIGTGKTTLCRAALGDLGPKTYISLVPDPFASREDLLKMLLIDFGVSSIQEMTTGALRGASRTELGYLLSAFLDSLTPDAFVIVIIDEAQNLSLPLIEETRILSDTFGAKGRLQIVFVGQPELNAKLKLAEMRQVDQRVSGYHRLEPMSRDAVAGYIQYRLQVAGGNRDRVLFAPAIVDVIHQRCGGVPRLINRVCDRALHVAFERKAEAVNREILDLALTEVGSAALLPSWDSIVFAAAPPAAAPAPVVAAAPPAPAPASAAAEMAPQIDDDEQFEKQIDHWVEKDLAPSRKLPPMRAFTDDSAVPERAPVDRRPAPERRAAPAPARNTTTPARAVTTDWPRAAQPETHMQRLWRVWAKRAAIAAAVFIALNVAIVGGSVLFDTVTPGTLPAVPKAPASALAGLAAPDAPRAEAPAAVPSAAHAAVADRRIADSAAAETAAPKAPVAESGEYLVGVGLFASREGADQLVDTLTQAGLPAMQRPYQLRRRQLQQIVLGPFFSRSDAAAELRRLQGLGGYDDASVIEASRQ